MGSNGDNGLLPAGGTSWALSLQPGMGGGGGNPHTYGPSDDEDDSSRDGSLKDNGNGDDMGGNGGSDAEGVWSPDIEQSFQEALAIYPPCGRRKIILSDEGKMYGRNELIARYIKLRTGKTRTRKQVSSHIQVLARRKAREVQSKIKTPSHKSDGNKFMQNGPDLQSVTNMSQFVNLLNLTQDAAAKEKALQSLTSAQIASLQNIQNQNQNASMVGVTGHPLHHLHHPHLTGTHPAHVATAAAGLAALGLTPPPTNSYGPVGLHSKNFNLIGSNGSLLNGSNNNNNNNNGSTGPYEGRSICSFKLRLTEFNAFMESGSGNPEPHSFASIHPPCYSDPILEDIDLEQISDKFPANKGGLNELFDKGPQDAFFLVKFWADIPKDYDALNDAYYGVTTSYESSENMVLTCSTKVCSFGGKAVEKLEEINVSSYQNGKYVYRIDRSEMCEYMVNFIKKLKGLPEKYMMNSVLENFTILQVVSNRDTNETLLCIAFVFEVSEADNGAQHHIYKLVKPNNNENH